MNETLYNQVRWFKMFNFQAVIYKDTIALISYRIHEPFKNVEGAYLSAPYERHISAYKSTWKETCQEI